MTVQDYCRACTLSHCQEDDYISACDHEHNAKCVLFEEVLTAVLKG